MRKKSHKSKSPKIKTNAVDVDGHTTMTSTMTSTMNDLSMISKNDRRVNGRNQKDVVLEEEDFFAQRQNMHWDATTNDDDMAAGRSGHNGGHSNGYSGPDGIDGMNGMNGNYGNYGIGGDLLGLSYDSQSVHSMISNTSASTSNDTHSHIYGNARGDNDLLGLSASSSMSLPDNSPTATTATNELLELSYNYETPKPMPTADLLGFDVAEDDRYDPSTQPQAFPNNNELLSLDYNVNNLTLGGDNDNINKDNAIQNPYENETSMKINVAYSALEQMRVANLEIEFGHNIDTQKCVQCIRQTPPDQIRKKYGQTSSFFGKSFRFKNDKPCMMCGSPTCYKHSDPNFLKSKIVICSDCSPLFSLDFIIECVCLNIAAEDDDDDDDEDNGKDVDDDISNSISNDDDYEDGKYDLIAATSNGSHEQEGKQEEKQDNLQQQQQQQQQQRQQQTIQSTPSNDSTMSSIQPQQPKRIFQPKNSLPLSPKEQLRRRNIKHMVDVYDRVHLMLTYSAQFIDEIATKLENNTRREDQVGLSSNSIGIASGLAGIAAAAAVVTPAGPPLIIASLLFGATAQASSSGSKLVSYRSEANRVALKIISYYNLLKSILVVTNVLRDALLEDNINVEQYVSRVVKAHDEAMIRFDENDDDNEESEDAVADTDANAAPADGTAGDGTTGPNDEQLTPNDKNDKKQHNCKSQSNSEEMEFEDDWETDDDFSVVSMRSKSSMATANITLSGIKENESTGDGDGDDDFGDFHKANSIDKADSLDTNSIASPNGSPTNKFTLSPTGKSIDDNISAKSNADAEDADQVPYPTEDKDKNAKDKKHDESLMERKDTVGKLARFYSRSSLAGTSLVGAATVTVFAGAALSLAHVAFEANNFASTIKRLQAGSPSKRAKVLRAIKKDVMSIPQTAVIAEEWDKYLAVLDERRKGNTHH